jgi:isobutyryl-CoA mutase
MDTEIKPIQNKIRMVTATSLFDGHDAAINLFRRLIQQSGAEVIHLGHNRSVQEIVDAAVQEDANGIAISSYQGGHIEFFKYMIDLLKEKQASHIQVFGGGGGVIIPDEIKELEAYGVKKIYSPQDGQTMGLYGIINHMMACIDHPVHYNMDNGHPNRLTTEHINDIARIISVIETPSEQSNPNLDALHRWLQEQIVKDDIPVVGITGTGGAGKSSITDELIRFFISDHPDKKIAVFCIDPSRRKTGGALLGDRIRLNAINHPNIYVRSLATRTSQSELSNSIKEAILVAKAAQFDLIIVETSGIGQGDSAIVDVTDVSLYVMTPDYGARTQLEKIDMLDYADLIILNKFDRRGAEDALRDIRKEVNHKRNPGHGVNPEQLPVFPTMAHRFYEEGVINVYQYFIQLLNERKQAGFKTNLSHRKDEGDHLKRSLIPSDRTRYLSDIANTVRNYADESVDLIEQANKAQYLKESASIAAEQGDADTAQKLEVLFKAQYKELPEEIQTYIENWDTQRQRYHQDELVFEVRGKEIRNSLVRESLAHTKIPKIAFPTTDNWGEIIRFMRSENIPGSFPYTGGVFPLKRVDEDPKRQFAGEGTPDRTNRRFHYLCKNDPYIRLSTAFDSVTLYGEDPDERPDIYGKVGESGVSVCSLDDVKRLYAGFELCHPNTSVSMTINGPAPMMLAMFLNTAIDQQLDKFKEEHGREPNTEQTAEIRKQTLSVVRGTVQADILKEDQAQNTCIFSTEFALRMMGDIQQYFIDQNVRNFYSVSISGYHIAEAGANPISQLAFTMANGFTYVEYYLSRGMHIDSFAPNLSFFFSNGLDPEYSVLGRVARRIWSIAIKYLYGGNERSQKLKYHIQTSGRSLHAQEISFNDIRTTLQALSAIYDNCNSLHTNSYDEAITTPTEESVRRAMAIQMIINREYGPAKNENPYQGSYFYEWLTDETERAVLAEFDRISDRGGVLGAMETQYQRGKIQEESMHYEMLKNTGEYPIIGVNTYVDERFQEDPLNDPSKLTRATKEEKETQIRNLRSFQKEHNATSEEALKRLQQTAVQGGNIFAELMETVRHASLGQISQALYEVGGKYRRNM